MDFESKLPENLNHLMSQRQITFAKLADELDISKSTLHGYRNGSLPHGIQSIFKIAKFFELTFDDLIFANLELKSPTPIQFAQTQITEAKLELPEPTDSLESQFFELHHQLRSIGETLKTLDYDLVDGVHLPSFGISLCQIAEKVNDIQNRVAREMER